LLNGEKGFGIQGQGQGSSESHGRQNQCRLEEETQGSWGSHSETIARVAFVTGHGSPQSRAKKDCNAKVANGLHT
jgi:hypothetical protein